jgi:hypothetical protein
MKKWSFVFTMLLCGVCNVQTAADAATLTVKVFQFSHNSPLSGVQVCFQNAENTRFERKPTNGQGVATFDSIAQGQITITVTVAAFVGQSRQVTMSAADRTESFTLNAGSGGPVCINSVPPPGNIDQPPHLSLVPLVLVSVGVDGVAMPFSSPTGIQRPTPEFFVPRNGTKVFNITTSGGNVNVGFGDSVPAGVPASTFEWMQQTLPAGNATGQLRYNGCASCPASFAFGVNVSSRNSASGSVKLNLTASAGKPQLISISRSGGTEVQPRYEIKFAAGTFDPSDSQAIATYSSNLKYRLIPENSSNFAGGTMFVVIPRLSASRNLQVFLKNPYGASGNLSVELPLQQVENGPLQFNCINCSTVFGDAIIHDEYSIKHNNSLGLLDASGTDEITIAPKRSGVTPCDEPDFIYHTALVKWIRDDGYSGDSAEQGTVTVSSHPPIDQLLRSPQNKVQINWTLKAFKGEHWYQVMFGVIDVVGVCPNRVVQ